MTLYDVRYRSLCIGERIVLYSIELVESISDDRIGLCIKLLLLYVHVYSIMMLVHV